MIDKDCKTGQSKDQFKTARQSSTSKVGTDAGSPFIRMGRRREIFGVNLRLYDSNRRSDRQEKMTAMTLSRRC
mgnify:CR=1 FL=1